MLIAVKQLRLLLREAIKDNVEKQRLIDTMRTAFSQLAKLIQDNPEIMSTAAGPRALNGVFYRLAPGELPTDQDVEKEVDSFMKYVSKGWFKTPEARQEHVDRWLRTMGPGGNKYDALIRAKDESNRRPKTAPIEGKTWGKYLFSPHRIDVPLEPDVPEETQAYKAIWNMMYRNKPLSSSVALNIKKLVDGGEYLNLLLPDNEYQVFHRGMVDVSTKQLTQLLGSSPNPQGGSNNVSSVFKPKRVGSSWTVNDDIARHYSLGGVGAGGAGTGKVLVTSSENWSIIISASRKQNPSSFVLNPKTLYDIGDLAGDGNQDNASSEEVYAIGPIKLTQVSYKPG